MYKYFFKPLFDFILSLFAIIILLPFFLLFTPIVAIAMKGNPFFVQPRPGKNGKIFKMIKYRTMTNAKDENGELLPDEKRLTKFGKLMRKLSLDELPEIFNIFAGQMSIVGPRPQLIKDLVFFDEKTMERQSIRPGLTGWAQVNGRNNVTWEEKFELDNYYLSKMSLLLDIKILFLTVFKVFARKDINTDGMETAEDYGDYLLRKGKISKEEYDNKLIITNQIKEEMNYKMIRSNDDRREKIIKNIWIINHYALTPSQGGLSRHFFFAKELTARGYNVRIFTSSAIHNTDINMIGEEEKITFKDVDFDGVHYTYIKCGSYKGNGLGRIKNMLGFSFSIRKIWKAYKHEAPDVIYTSTPDLLTPWRAVPFAKKHKLPCVVEVRDLWPLSVVEYNNISEKNPVIVALYMLERHIYKKADALVFTMPGGGDYIKDKGWEKKVSLEKVFNINNGIDVETQERQAKENAFPDPDLDDDSFKVIYCGSIRKVNNVGKLIEAAELLKENRDIKFLIYGDGTQREELEIYCKEKGIGNVVFKGYVDKKFVPHICTKAGANIISVKQTGVSKYGVSWNKLFDYMNAGKPIISTVKVNFDLIEANECGISCENQDVSTIADAILKIKNCKKTDYDKMCYNAKQAAKQFDFKVLTDKFEQVINFAVEHKEK